eukprot:m.28814 g.28814  ORF g.28814 m.28814 type:complete len:61 (-) comp9079_c0_seq1:1034-1216(-)
MQECRMLLYPLARLATSMMGLRTQPIYSMFHTIESLSTRISNHALHDLLGSGTCHVHPLV